MPVQVALDARAGVAVGRKFVGGTTSQAAAKLGCPQRPNSGPPGHAVLVTSTRHDIHFTPTFLPYLHVRTYVPLSALTMLD